MKLANPKLTAAAIARKHGGFTLIELLIVIAVLAILAGVFVAGYGNVGTTAGGSKVAANHDEAKRFISNRVAEVNTDNALGGTLTLPADQAAWVALLNSTNPTNPKGGAAFGTGASVAGTVGVDVKDNASGTACGTVGAASTALKCVELSRPAFGKVTSLTEFVAL